MSELDTHTFRLAVAQFNEAAEAMHLDPHLRELLNCLGSTFTPPLAPP